MEKLAALVPPPRFHLVRYHGILGPCASERDRVVPGGTPTQELRDLSPTPTSRPSALTRAEDALRVGATEREAPDPTPDLRPEGAAQEGGRTRSELAPQCDGSPSQDGATLRPRRLAWSELLQRVFAIDVLECPRCGGRMRLLAAIHPPDATQSILECLDLPSRAPPMAAPQPDGAEGDDGSWAGDFDAGA